MEKNKYSWQLPSIKNLLLKEIIDVLAFEIHMSFIFTNAIYDFNQSHQIWSAKNYFYFYFKFSKINSFKLIWQRLGLV